MEKIFICQLVPNDFVTQNKHLSQAANNFCFNFIKALGPDITYSFIPVFVKEKELFWFDNVKIHPLQTRIFAHNCFGKYLNVFIDNLKLIMESVRSSKGSRFWFYNLLSYHYVFAYLTIKFILRRKCYFIVADHNPGQRQLLKMLVDKSDGLISFSLAYLRGSCNKNKALFPGIVNGARQDIFVERKSIVKQKVLFSGRLELYTGIDLALEVFAGSDDYDLIVSGEGSLKNLVLDYAAKYSNIQYVGFLPYDEYLEVLKEVILCLSFRNPQFPENQFNFPSKILEYMEFGKIVISTMEYDVLDESTIYYSKFDHASVKKVLEDLKRLSDDIRFNLSCKIRKSVIDKFSVSAMSEVVERIMRRPE